MSFNVMCLATGSKGNCYIVKSDSATLLLDAGISKENIDKHLNFNECDLIFISHIHQDHSKALKDFKYVGVPIITGFENKEFILALKTSKLIAIQFPVLHGDTNNNGLIVQTKNELMLYATDFNICEYNLSKYKFTRIMVECNFVDEAITDVDDIKVRRQINTHMGLNGLQVFLDSLDLSKCQEIILMHSSADYGNTILEGATISQKYKIKVGVCLARGGIDYYGSR